MFGYKLVKKTEIENLKCEIKNLKLELAESKKTIDELTKQISELTEKNKKQERETITVVKPVKVKKESVEENPVKKVRRKNTKKIIVKED
jgi:predicted RNase H-like nuclease (RuvC/YqgF family)